MYKLRTDLKKKNKNEKGIINEKKKKEKKGPSVGQLVMDLDKKPSLGGPGISATFIQ